MNEVQENKKWIAMVKIFDAKMSGEWHSGSVTTYKSKAGLETKEEAQAFIDEITERYDGENGFNRVRSEYQKYELTPCILSYDTDESENVEKFFKHMF